MSDHNERQGSNDRENDETSSREEQETAGAFSWAKKIMTVGVGTFFLSEEALKALVNEFKLPKEIVFTILDGAKGVRKEFMQNFVSEMMTKIQDRVDPAQIMAEFLKKNEVTFEVKVKVKEKGSEKESK